MKKREDIIAALQAGIDKANVEERDGMSYVPGFYVKDQLNVIFDPDNWDFETLSTELVYGPTENEKGLQIVVFKAHARITVRIGDRTFFRDGSACGSGNKRSIGDSMHDAIGEAETDALKRAASLLGRTLGLALYDKKQRHVTLSPNVVQYGAHKGAPIAKAKSQWLTAYLERLPEDADAAHRQAVEAEIERRLAAESEKAA